MLKECATFAGGCFWCLQAAFSSIPGVLEVTTGFMGGLLEDPTYEQVSQGTTDHKEVILVEFDPSLIYYKELVEAFWQTINPTDRTGQFKDRGPQYTTAIFTHSQEQERIARQSKYALEKEELFSEPIATQILPARTFYRAETHHQNYDKKHPREYQLYHKGSGREDFILEHWRYKPKKLTTLQESVLYENGTEPPFDNRHWNTKEEGIYIDITTGDPLFCSLHKFDSGTGWPSFYQPIDNERVVEVDDFSYDQHRIEVRSSEGAIHLGHLFSDGPPPTGLRYCINSAALHFIPLEKMAKEGYIEFLSLFR